MEHKPEVVDSVAAVAAGVAAGAQQIDESMADIGDLMADMFGAVAVAIDGQAQGGPRAVVAARRRQRELDEQAQRDRDKAAAPTAGSAAVANVAPPPRAAAAAHGASGPADPVRPGAAASGCATRREPCVLACADRASLLLTLACLPRSSQRPRLPTLQPSAQRQPSGCRALAADAGAASRAVVPGPGRGGQVAPTRGEPRRGDQAAKRVCARGGRGGEAADAHRPGSGGLERR